ncbi:MAG: hypothetical protein ACREYD_05565 [Casimicrobiaceae bacterium]
MQSEIDRMRAMGERVETIAAFQTAADVHIALCDAGSSPAGDK